MWISPYLSNGSLDENPLASDSLVLVAKHHPDDADGDADGRQQESADLRAFVQVRQVVLRDPVFILKNKHNLHVD